ncbi:MAG: HEAT repeat domain-containing protein [Planctomycetota bacterium]|nr:HEAT repeat domain-containing protein [Planctomycetota bacterium]
MKTTSALFLASLAIATGLSSLASVSAHGGRYRGPKPPNQIQPPWASKIPQGKGPQTTRPLGGVPVPRVPSPAGPPASGPLTPRGVPIGGAIDLARWQGWWEMNRDRYLLVKDALSSPATATGSDQYFMGPQRRPAEDNLRASEYEAMANLILPALHEALRNASDRDIVSACLVGMAKIGLDTNTIKLRDVLVSYLSATNQEVRETAALALGISRQGVALPVLRELLLDTATGRVLTKRIEVDYRVRSFAAYGLGILAANGDADTRGHACRVLREALADENSKNRDIRVAIVNALGVLGVSPDKSGKDKRVLWQTLPALQKFYEADLGKGTQIAQAHVPIAVARLLGRGDGPDHLRYREIFYRDLFAKTKRHNTIYQSAAIALGLMTPQGEASVSDRLFRYYEVGRNQQARYFSLISMGEIGGSANRTRLLKVLARGQKNLERPWAALGLGVLSYKLRRSKGGEVDRTVGAALLRQLTTVKNRETVGAFSVALGLCGYLDAAKPMRKMLQDHPHHDGMAGSLCTGLALMGDQNAVGLIRMVMHRSIRRPEVLRQAAIALAKLRDRGVASDLIDMLSEDNPNTTRMAALAGALQFIGNRQTVKTLLKLLGDDELTNLSRAFVAAALGGIADPMLLPFNERYARHSNYRAVVETLSNQMTGILDLL